MKTLQQISPRLLKSAEAEAECLIMIAKFNIARRFMSDGGLENVLKIHAFQKVTPINELIQTAEACHA